MYFTSTGKKKRKKKIKQISFSHFHIDSSNSIVIAIIIASFFFLSPLHIIYRNIFFPHLFIFFVFYSHGIAHSIIITSLSRRDAVRDVQWKKIIQKKRENWKEV
jgi:hypothetical protein